MIEYLSVFDQYGNVLDEKVDRREKLNLEEGKYFKIVLVFIKNNNKFLIQKCSKDKGENYAVTGGHVKYKTSSIDTACIEVEEELGIKISKDELKEFKSYTYEKGICDVYYLEKDIDINELKLQEEEVESVFWMTLDEIKQLIDNNLFRKGNIKPLFDLVKYLYGDNK